MSCGYRDLTEGPKLSGGPIGRRTSAGRFRYRNVLGPADGARPGPETSILGSKRSGVRSARTLSTGNSASWTAKGGNTSYPAKIATRDDTEIVDRLNRALRDGRVSDAGI